MTEEVPRTAAALQIRRRRPDSGHQRRQRAAAPGRQEYQAGRVAARGAFLYPCTMRVDAKPFLDNRVREALKLVDRPAGDGRHGHAFGHAAPGQRQPDPAGLACGLHPRECPKRDIAKAKELLAEAGYANGIDIDLNTAEGSPGMLKAGRKPISRWPPRPASASTSSKTRQTHATGYGLEQARLLHHRLVVTHAGAGLSFHFPQVVADQRVALVPGMTTTRSSTRRPAGSTKRNAPSSITRHRR